MHQIHHIKSFKCNKTEFEPNSKKSTDNKILKNFFGEKTVMTLTITDNYDFLVNYIGRYHVLYFFRKKKD